MVFYAWLELWASNISCSYLVSVYFLLVALGGCGRNSVTSLLIHVRFLVSVKTGPSVVDAAIGRISQTSKVIAEGGYEKIFQQTFEILPEEKLKKSYACYLSTSAGPVIGVLYLSTAKLAFCSDNPLSYKVGDKTEWSYYKVPSFSPLFQQWTMFVKLKKCA